MGLPRRQLVILQQSPFCNIDCRYCYLPHRSHKERMSPATLEKIYTAVFECPLIRDPITFLWHAGEPLAVGHAFMEQAFALSAEVNQRYQRTYTHNIQTNGTLLDARWVDIFQRYAVGVGLSLDGPEFIHNQQRVARNGRGTHQQVIRGVKLLQEAGIQFEVIMVLTYLALEYPDEIFDFFDLHQIKGLALNIDEIEGVHRSSSYDQSGAAERYRRFMKRFLARIWESPGKMRARELYSMIPFIVDPKTRIGDGDSFNNTNVPLQIITFDYRGKYSTFCPEFSGTKSTNYGDFVMGDVHTDPIENIFQNEVFRQVNTDVQRGVDLCRSTCQYWSLCGGGAPSNKYFETGRLDVAETKHCRIHVKVLADTILDVLSEHLDVQEVDAV